ncbi:MAG: nucleotidyltransferase domain-containing protein [Candidatus Nanoarchaeia archaeon]
MTTKKKIPKTLKKVEKKKSTKIFSTKQIKKITKIKVLEKTKKHQKNRKISKPKISNSPATKLSSLIEEQKKSTKPDMKVLEKINSFVAKINSELKKKKIKAEASVGGSIAKGTFIKDNFDADIFIRFDSSFKGKNISEILESLLKEMKINANKVHGSRDYFQIKEEFTYELVPVLRVTDYKEAENVADMSPLHVEYFNKKARNIKNLREEIRITKLFMKSGRVYGAESYIKGFSGHVVDLLLIKYGTFLNLVKNASKWSGELIIDIEKHHIDPKMSLNSSKISGPLIVVDPLQKNRNAAAALSKECFEQFEKRCKEFLINPSNDFFRMPDFSKIVAERISKTKNSDIFTLNIVPHKGKRDVVGSKILKIKEHIEKIAKEEEFKITWSDWFFDDNNSQICFAFEKDTLGSTKKVRGPPLDMKDAVESFKRSHIKTFVESNYIYAEDIREYPDAKTLIEKVMMYPFIIDKYVSFSLAETKNK